MANNIKVYAISKELAGLLEQAAGWATVEVDLNEADEVYDTEMEALADELNELNAAVASGRAVPWDVRRRIESLVYNSAVSCRLVFPSDKLYA